MRAKKLPGEILSTAIAGALLTLTLSSAAIASPQRKPQALSSAEREAVVLATEYLQEGPSAWWARLSTASPLRALGTERFALEVELRAGPASDARWELRKGGAGIGPDDAILTIEHPSGFAETLHLTLVEEDGRYQIQTIRSLIDPLGQDAIGAGDAVDAADAAGSPEAIDLDRSPGVMSAEPLSVSRVELSEPSIQRLVALTAEAMFEKGTGRGSCG